MDWMFLIYGVMQKQVSEYGTHYNLVVKIIAWIQFFLGLILSNIFILKSFNKTKGLETSSYYLQVLELKRTSEGKCLNHLWNTYWSK